jgi:hypothetical protein
MKFTSQKLAMALVWLIAAGCFFFWEWLNPDWPGLKIWDTGISIGWVALLLALYNLIWWGIAFSNQKQQRALAEADAKRRNEMRKRSQPPVELNPSFDFTDDRSVDGPKSA